MTENPDPREHAADEAGDEAADEAAALAEQDARHLGPDSREPITLQQALDEFLAGAVMAEVVTWSGTTEELAAQTAAWRAEEDARLAAAGTVPVSVVTGDPETGDDAKLIYSLPDLAAQCGADPSWRGGNDYTTFFFSGPDASAHASAFIAAVDGIAAVKPWWSATRTAHPVFPGWGPPA